MNTSELVNTYIKLSVSDYFYNRIQSNDRIIMNNREFVELTTTPQKEKVSSKPQGLWYALGHEWIDWVREAMPEHEHKNLYKLDLNFSNICVLDREKSIEFTEKYGGQLYDFDNFIYINWVKVAQDFSGIEIHDPSRSNWMAGWDVSSGCVWNKDAINSIKRVM